MQSGQNMEVQMISRGRFTDKKGLFMKKKIIITVSVAGIVVVLLLIFLLLYFLGIIVFTDSIKDTGRYEEIWDKCEKGLMEVFPEKISEDAETVDFIYEKHSSLLFDDYEIYLEAKYTQTEYDEEVERLSDMQDKLNQIYGKDENGYGYDCKQLLYEEEYFIYPAYIMCADNTLCRYSYALTDEDNLRIIYIYLYQVEPKRIKFDKQYLPEGYIDSTCGYSEVEYSVTTLW